MSQDDAYYHIHQNDPGARRAFVAARVDRVPERDIFKPNPASRPSQSSSFGLRVRRCLQPQEDQHPRWLTILLWMPREETLKISQVTI